jgi:predicted nucleic acid-binding protein
MYFSDGHGVEIHEIQAIFRTELNYNLPISSFEKTIKRLIDNKRIEIGQSGSKYKLTDNSKKEFENIQATSDKTFTRIINKLFHNAPENREKYIEPFWFSMDYIFSEIGEYSAKLVEGKIDNDTILKPILNSCISALKLKFQINHEYFIKRLEFFFNETNEPLYNDFRWILAQNFFITNSLGINPESETFSKELFQNITFYLDTNVLLSLISDKNKYYNNAFSFIEAANKLDIKFCICETTFSELERWVITESESILKAGQQIPKNTKTKIGSCIYQDLQLKIEELGEITVEEKQELLNEIVKGYLDYKKVIGDLIPANNIEYIDDIWFDTIENEKTYEESLALIKDKYFEIRKRKKSDNAATHDTKVLLWINKQIIENETDFRFVTSDYSLPLIRINDSSKSDSIILEAVLQWLVPLTSNGENHESFSQSLKQRILPKEFMFEVKDFLIFEELHMECSELPSEDVEDCILFLKQNAPNLNPNEPADREILASHIAKYFIDPGRKYKKELHEREQENEMLASKLGDVYKMIEELREQSEKKDNELEQAKLEHSAVIENIKTEHSEKLDEVIGTLNGVTSELDTLREEKRQDKIQNKIRDWKRPAKYALVFLLVLIIFGILEFVPDWGWNFPAKLLVYFNSLGENSKGTFNIGIGLNIFLLSGLVISLFIFIYNRLLNKDNIEGKLDKLNDSIK